MGTRHGHRAGLGGHRAHRPPAGTPPRASAAQARRAAATPGHARRCGAHLPSARGPSPPGLPRPAGSGHPGGAAARCRARRAGAAQAGAAAGPGGGRARGRGDGGLRDGTRGAGLARRAAAAGGPAHRARARVRHRGRGPHLLRGGHRSVRRDGRGGGTGGHGPASGRRLGPLPGEHHLDPGRAAEALARLRPRSAVPVHFGTYWPIGMDAVRPHEFHSPGAEFVRLAAGPAPEVEVHLLRHGESVRLEAAR